MPTHAQHLQQRTGTCGPCEQAMLACEFLLLSWEHALEYAFSAKFCAHPEGTSSCLHLYTQQLQQAVTAYRSWTIALSNPGPEETHTVWQKTLHHKVDSLDLETGVVLSGMCLTSMQAYDGHTSAILQQT